jgi:ketosteroid isomerase-like protein
MTTATLAPAEALLDALRAHDLDRVADAFEPDAQMSALLPRGHDEWRGAIDIRAAFARWFGDVAELEVVDSSIGRCGDLLQLRWRLRVRGGPRFGAQAMVVEQHACAQPGPTGRIGRMSLLCTGFWPQPRVTHHEEDSES